MSLNNFHTKFWLLLGFVTFISFFVRCQKIEIRPHSKIQDGSFIIELIVADSLIETTQTYAGQNRYFYSISRSEFDSIKRKLVEQEIPEPRMKEIYGSASDVFILIFIMEGDKVSEYYLESPQSFEDFFSASAKCIQNEALKKQVLALREFAAHLRE